MATNNAVNTTLSSQTGTGSFVGSTSPALVTPDLGTPSAGVLTSCTGLPVSSGISGLGTGVATALATNVNGTGAISLTTSPTFVTPALGAATATSINFGGSTLSTYQTVTAWTPVFTFSTPGDLSVVYTQQTGLYSRIGSIVHIILYLACTPTFTTASGSVNITGLPFTSNSTSNNISIGALFVQAPNFPASTTSLFSQIAANTSLVTIFAAGSGVNAVNFGVTQFTTGVARTIQTNLTYLV